MRCHLELALQLRTRQTEGLELAHTFGITASGYLAGFLLFVFPFFHALGEAGFRVDESFTGITHNLIIRIGWPPSPLAFSGRLEGFTFEPEARHEASGRRRGPRERGIAIAAFADGGPMAEPHDDLVDTPGPEDTRDADPKSRVHSQKERSGVESPDNRSRDTATGRANVEDVDPDSAQSDIDRDDSSAD